MEKKRILTVRPVVKTRQSTKFYAILLISVVFTVLILAPTISSLVNRETLIDSIGEIAYAANSGSVEDIQAAVNEAEAAGGVTVYVPAGNWTFNANSTYRVEISGGVNVFGAGKDKTILQLPSGVTDIHTFMFVIDGSNGKPVRISGIGFVGRGNTATGDTAIYIEDTKDFRVDHCSFRDMGGGGVGVMNPNPDKLTQGVIDHCDFIDIFQQAALDAGVGFGYGVYVGKEWVIANCPWEPDVINLFGKYNGHVFVEDCYFEGNRHAVMSGAGGYYVLRHSIIRIYEHGAYNAFHMIDQHPARTETYSGRCIEIYDNIIEDIEVDEPPWNHRVSGVHSGGGGGVIFNNTLRHLINAIILEGAETTDPQVTPKCWTRNLYIWNNTFDNVWYEITLQSNEELGGGPPPTEWCPGDGAEPGTWYCQQPPLGGYIPYTYPHPLTLG